MQINTFLENYESTKRRNELLKQAEIRHLTDQEKNELEEIIDSIDEFEQVLLNFE